MKNKKMLIGALLIVVILMGIGYAAFSTNLIIGGSVKTAATTWGCGIQSVTKTSVEGNANGTSSVSGNATTLNGLSVYPMADLATTLVSPGDSVTYSVVISNIGSIPATLQMLSTTNVTSTAGAGEVACTPAAGTGQITCEYKTTDAKDPDGKAATATIKYTVSPIAATSLTAYSASESNWKTTLVVKAEFVSGNFGAFNATNGGTITVPLTISPTCSQSASA